MKIDVIYAHYFAAVNVDDLLIEQISTEQQKPFGAIGRAPFRSRRGGANAAVDGGNGRQGQDPITRRGLDNEEGDTGAVFLRGEGHLAHPAASRARGVVNGRAQ